MTSLNGCRVLVVGASSGIGAAAARRFAGEGARLVLLARGEEGLERVAARARAVGAEAHVLPADLADRPAVEAAVQEAAMRLGGLDVLLLNAAAVIFGPFEAAPPEAFDHSIDVTLRAPLWAVRAALPHLDASGGLVLTTGSLMSQVPLPTFSSYAAAKHGLRGALNTLALELRSRGSRVGVAMVHPGPVDTPMWDTMTSATGTLPDPPPDGHDPDVIARALVVRAERPGRPETTVGLETKAVELLFGLARPAADLLLVGVDRWYRSGRLPAPAPGALWLAGGTGRESGPLPGRDSLTAALWLGPRLLPRSPRSAVRLAGNLGRAALTVARSPGRLLRAPAAPAS